jgi:hypothetical protein
VNAGCFRRSLVPYLALAALFWSGSIHGQQVPETNGIPAHLVVTVEPHKGTDVPSVKRDDVSVYEGRDRDQIVDWVPAQGDRAGLELFIMLDDGSSSALGTQFGDIKNFINAQPTTTKIGVAYMQNGIARVEQNLTTDHAQAAKAIRLPLGISGANGSPYFSLSDLVKKWPASADRREVLMVTDGIDRYYGTGDLLDPYLSAAIDDSQRAGILVSAIYAPGTGHFGHSYWQTYWGQIYLSKLTDETGGESYYIGFNGPAVAFQPYLTDLGRRLSHQYLLSFLAKPEKKGGWRSIKVTTELPDIDLVSANKVYVAAPER